MFGSVGGWGSATPGGGSGVVITAQNGVSKPSANVVELGNAVGGSAAVLLNNRDIPMAGFYLRFSNGPIWFNGATGATPTSGTGTRLMWIPAKKAFRAGEVLSTEWDDANIGTGSAAFGLYSIASGSNTLAFGFALASGSGSFAGGSYGPGSGSTTRITASGVASFNFSYKNGDSTSLGAQADYSAILGGVDGELNTNNTGCVYLAGNGAMSIPSAVTYTTFTPKLMVMEPSNVGTAVFGATSFLGSEKFRFTGGSLVYDGTTGNVPVTGAGTRLMWVPSRRSLHAGTVSGTQWDSIGLYNIVGGLDNTVIGESSLVGGRGNNIASTSAGNNIVCGQNNVINVAVDCAAFGFANTLQSNSLRSLIVGNSNTAKIQQYFVSGRQNNVNFTSTVAHGGFGETVGYLIVNTGDETYCYGSQFANAVNTTAVWSWSNVVALRIKGYSDAATGYNQRVAVGVGVNAPTARLHLMANGSDDHGVNPGAASTGQLKFDGTGVALDTPETGLVEFFNSRWHFTPITNRHQIKTKRTIIFTSGASTTLTVDDEHIIVNKGVGSATTVNLPATPADDDEHIISDGKGDAAANNITIGRNGNNIDGAAADAVINVNLDSKRLRFMTGYGWKTIA